MRNFRNSFRALLFPALLLGCTTTNQESALNRKEIIQPPLTQVKIPKNTFEVDASKGKLFSLPNGSTISVPSDCFVDKEGKQIKGKVKISYIEFHDAADIILSGIPMTYDSGGVSGNFQTAGMFEITGFQKEKPVYIANGKNIRVKMASYANDHHYNFYVLNEGKGDWGYKGQGKNEVNNQKEITLKALTPEPEKPLQVKEASEDQFVFDLDINVNAYPELKDFKGLMWQYAGSSDAMNPEKHPWMFKQKWDDIDFKEENREQSTFRVILKNQQHSFETVITPVLKGKELEKAKKLFSKSLKEYNQVVDLRKKQKERLKLEVDLYRSFAVADFGIYNYDRFYKMPEALQLTADFNFEGKPADHSGVLVYLITGDGRTVIKYPHDQWHLFSFLPDSRNSLIAVLPDASVATFTSDDFQKVDLDKMKKDKKYIFNLKKSKAKISSPEDLKKIIESIS